MMVIRILELQRHPPYPNVHGVNPPGATAGEFELMFKNTGVHKIVRISKTNQDNPSL